MIAKKVLLVGNFGVGKTSLIRRYVLNEFSEDYISTIGARVSTKIVKVNNQEIKFLIWDVAGVNDNDKIPKAYFLGSLEHPLERAVEPLDHIGRAHGLEHFDPVGVHQLVPGRRVERALVSLYTCFGTPILTRISCMAATRTSGVFPLTGTAWANLVKLSIATRA